MNLSVSHRLCYLTLGVIHDLGIRIITLIAEYEAVAMTVIGASSNVSFNQLEVVQVQSPQG